MTSSLSRSVYYFRKWLNFGISESKTVLFGRVQALKLCPFDRSRKVLSNALVKVSNGLLEPELWHVPDSTCMYYHSTRIYHDHNTCIYHDHSTCMYYDHSTCIGGYHGPSPSPAPPGGPDFFGSMPPRKTIVLVRLSGFPALIDLWYK